MTKFGTVVSIAVSPAIVLKIAELLEEWLIELSTDDGEIDAEREAIGMAQKILSAVVKEAIEQAGEGA